MSAAEGAAARLPATPAPVTGGRRWSSIKRAPRPPESPSSPPSILLQALLLVLAAALSGFTILQGIAPHDEGLMLQAAGRIAGGQWPYRDFWMNYPPGQALLLAGLQELFGPSLLAWRVLVTALDAVIALLAYRLARRRAPELYALVAWIAVAGAMAYPSLPEPNPTALALAFGALLAARARPASAGALAGLACFFRLEIGVAAIIGVLLDAPRGGRGRALAAAIVAAALTLGPFFAVAPGAMLHDTLGFYGIQGLQRLPFPFSYHGPLKPSKLIEFYIPLILVAGAALWAAATAGGLWTLFGPARRRREPVRVGRPGVALEGARIGRGWAGRDRAVARTRTAVAELGAWSPVPLALVGLAYLLGRTDEFHLVPLAAVLPVMLAWAAPAARPLALKGALILALALIAIHGLERRAGQARHPPALAAVPGPAGDGVQTSPDDARDLAQLEHELGVLTRPGVPIFVADPRFDLVHAGDPLLYVITGHPNPTRYDVMQPGVVTTAPVQREMIDSLERSHTRVIVRWLDPRATLVEPNGAGRSSGVNLLGRWIAANYRDVASYGYYQVLVRRGTRGALG